MGTNSSATNHQFSEYKMLMYIWQLLTFNGDFFLINNGCQRITHLKFKVCYKLFAVDYLGRYHMTRSTRYIIMLECLLVMSEKSLYTLAFSINKDQYYIIEICCKQRYNIDVDYIKRHCPVLIIYKHRLIFDRCGPRLVSFKKVKFADKRHLWD